MARTTRTKELSHMEKVHEINVQLYNDGSTPAKIGKVALTEATESNTWVAYYHPKSHITYIPRDDEIQQYLPETYCTTYVTFKSQAQFIVFKELPTQRIPADLYQHNDRLPVRFTKNREVKQILDYSLQIAPKWQTGIVQNLKSLHKEQKTIY
jgi:RAB protein geranylgeranyltransferase component A